MSNLWRLPDAPRTTQGGDIIRNPLPEPTTMPSLDCLLDSLGQPPPELCLEWAWQIERAVEGRLDQPLDWSQLELTESGELQLLSCIMPSADNSPANSRAHQLVDQLLLWSADPEAATEPEPDGATAPDPVDRRAQLTERTLKLVADPAPTGARGFTRADGCDPRPRVAVPAAAYTRRKNSAQSSKLPLSIAGAVFACSLLGYAFWPRSIANKGRALATPPATPASSTQTAAPDFTQSPQANIPQQEDRSPVELLSTADSAVEDHAGSFGLAAATDFSLGPADLLSLSELEFSTEEAVQTDAQGARPPTADATSSGAVEASSIPALPATDDADVMAEMEKVTESAAATAREMELPDSNPDAPELPPLTITTFPMQQLHKPPAAFHLATRKPAWELRLEVSEGFEVAPVESQIVSGRDIVGWLITDSDASQPATKILVQAQLANARSASLRWRIVAGAEDVPQVFVPLGREHLDAMQQNLTQLTRRMQLAVEQLRAVGRSAGIASEVRSSMSAQRRGLESKIKLSQRALEIVADANQLEGWLDGQFSVHARLLDQSRPDSPPLLQFGTQQQD